VGGVGATRRGRGRSRFARAAVSNVWERHNTLWAAMAFPRSFYAKIPRGGHRFGLGGRTQRVMRRLMSAGRMDSAAASAGGVLNSRKRRVKEQKCGGRCQTDFAENKKKKKKKQITPRSPPTMKGFSAPRRILITKVAKTGNS